MSHTGKIDMIVELKCFWDFKKGDEKALAGLYDQLYKPLLYHGLRIIKDRFVVNSIIQEAFLKAWNFRERMTSTLHVYRFIRLNITWGCYGYFRQATYKRHYGSVIYTDDIDYYTSPSCFESEINEQLQKADEEKLQTIYNVIPYLPATRQNLINLYFKYGFSYKQIANRYATSKQAISRELQNGLEHLKKIINSKKRLDNPVVKSPKTILPYNEILEGEMLQVFKLRYEMKLSFESIALQLNLPQLDIQQLYIAAHIKIQQLTQKHK